MAKSKNPSTGEPKRGYVPAVNTTRSDAGSSLVGGVGGAMGKPIRGRGLGYNTEGTNPSPREPNNSTVGR